MKRERKEMLAQSQEVELGPENLPPTSLPRPFRSGLLFTARCQGGVAGILSEGRDTEGKAVGLYPGTMMTEPGEATRFPPSETKSRKQVCWTKCLQVPSHCAIARECLG